GIRKKLGRLLGPLAVIDVGAGTEPLDYRPGVVAQRCCTCYKPAIHPVVAAMAYFNLVIGTLFQGARPFFHAALVIVGVQDKLGPGPSILLGSQPTILEPALIRISDGAVGCRGPDNRGQRLSHKPEPLFAVSKSFFRALALDELSNLAACVCHHLEQFFIGPGDLAAE